MKRSVVSVLTLVLAFPEVVCAGGVDCSAAGTARQHLVCDDDALSATDRQLSQAYAMALGRLSSEGQRILRENQLNWSRYVDALCPMAADPARRGEAIDCVAQAYADRLLDLQRAAVRMGPFLFSRVHDYSVSVLRTRANEYDSGLARHQVAYPRIDQPATHQTALWNALVVHTDHLSACDGGDGDTWTDYSLDLATAELISVTWNFSDYCPGTPHGFGENKTQTLVLSPEPHPLIPSDLFRSDVQWAGLLSTLLIARVRQAAGADRLAFEEGDEAHIADVAHDTQRWSLGTDGLGFQFDPYEIGPHTFQPHVVIPWADLRDVMVPSPPLP